jgi:hypothetical protein
MFILWSVGDTRSFHHELSVFPSNPVADVPPLIATLNLQISPILLSDTSTENDPTVILTYSLTIHFILILDTLVVVGKSNVVEPPICIGCNVSLCRITLTVCPPLLIDISLICRPSYITTLGGASYRLITPGIYNVYTVSGLSVQIVFWPCNNDIYCRQIKEISINSGGQTVSVMRHNETLQPMHIGGSTTFDFPTTTSVSSSWYKTCSIWMNAIYSLNHKVAIRTVPPNWTLWAGIRGYWDCYA